MKRGFTLVELLAVIIVLAAILLIVIPSVNHIISSSKKSLSDTQIKNIEKAAEQYYLSEGMDENKSCVNINYLIENEYLNGDKIIDTNEEEMVGSVKIEYKNNKYNYTYIEERCGICIPLIGDGTQIGDKLECEVKPGTKYNFYVLSKEDDTTNLIMDRNIGSAPWISEEDFFAFGGTEEDAAGWMYGILGPVTLMKEVDNLTKDWSNIPNLNTIHNDAGGSFTNFKITSKARLPYYDELDSPLTDKFLFDNMYVECYDDDGNFVDCDVATEIMGDAQYVNVGNDSLYGVFDTADPTYSYFFYWDGGLMDNQISFDGTNDIRPVINVPNNDIQSTNPPTYICRSVDEDTVTTGNIPEDNYESGDEYICEVKPGIGYHFFVVSEEKNKVNLILESSISETGEPVINNNLTPAKIAWINNDDYYGNNPIPSELLNDGAACQYGNLCSFTDKGPATAINTLNTLLKSWVYIPNINDVYSDKFGRYTNFKIAGKARLPKYDEVYSAGCRPPDGEDSSLYLNSCPLWLVNYSRDLPNDYDGGQVLTVDVGYYFLLDTNFSYQSEYVSQIITNNGLISSGILPAAKLDARPVISLSKNSIK